MSIRSTGASKVKRRPCGSTVSAVIEPPIRVASSPQIDSPRPVPPYRRVVEASAWTNFLNRVGSCAGVTPGPVSSTTNLSPPSLQEALTRTWPSSVNLTALEIRLARIWHRRVESPRQVPMAAGSTRVSKLSPLASAMARKVCAARSTRVSRSKSACSSSILRASILARSSTSDRMVSRAWPDWVTTVRRSRWRWESSSAAIAWAMPSTPFRGVRISWLMVARKSLLARLAPSAWALADSIAAKFFARRAPALTQAMTINPTATTSWKANSGDWWITRAPTGRATATTSWGATEAIISRREAGLIRTALMMAPPTSRPAQVSASGVPDRISAKAREPNRMLATNTRARQAA